MCSTDRVTHVCQRCCNPLKLTPDLERLQQDKILALIDAQRPERDDSQPPIAIPVKNAGSDYPCYFVPPSPFAINTEAEALAILQQHSIPTTSLDHRQKVSSSLFDVLSGRTEVDHPLCQECADVLITAKQKCVEYQEEELSCLTSYLAYLEKKAARAQARSRLRTECSNSDDAPSVSPEISAMRSMTDDSSRTVNWLSCISSSNQSSALPTKPIPPSLNYEEEETDDDEEEGNYCDEEVDSPEEDVEGLSNIEHVPSGQHSPESSDKEQTTKSNKKRKKHYRASLEELRATVNKLQLNLDVVLAESARLDQQLESDEAELKRRSEELDRAQTQYNEQKLALLEEEEELFALEARVKRSERHLHRLLRTNVLNTVFPIWYDGHFCIINGLHLGRLANRPISWDEINGAWGQCAMLLQCIARKLNLTFNEHRVVPAGSQSKVIDLSNHKEYPLYYTTTGMQLFAASKFDNAMCLFLKCLHQVQQRIEELTQTKLPYRIRDGGKMYDPRDGRSYSIKWTGNSEENWTKALKMMLLNMKWIIARLAAIEGTKKTLMRTEHSPVSPELLALGPSGTSSKHAK